MPILELRSQQAPNNIQFLRGLKPPEVNLILGAGKLRRFSAKCLITHQGESAGHFMLMWRGRARYFFQTQNGRKLNLMPITPGLIFAGAALVSGSSAYVLSSEAVQDSVVLVWEGSTIRALARRFPQLLQNALFIALDHFDWYTSAYAALGSQSARERFARVLVALAPKIGRSVLGGVELDVTNEELANSANITHYTASRMVTQLKKVGALRKQRGKIVLRSPEKLFLRAL
jgi:CRP-like cAMP-binding protein